MLLLYVWFEHPGHTYGGFIPSFSEWRMTGMHYVTRKSHQMQKQKFGIMCPGAFFVESIPVPPEHKKWCIDVSRPEAPECPT
jgi:hypothetical protein